MQIYISTCLQLVDLYSSQLVASESGRQLQLWAVSLMDYIYITIIMFMIFIYSSW